MAGSGRRRASATRSSSTCATEKKGRAARPSPAGPEACADGSAPGRASCGRWSPAVRFVGFATRQAYSGTEGGADIGLVAAGADQPSSVVHCKGWNVYTVGIKPVRELRAVMAAAGVPQGVLVACGTFTSEAKEWSRGESIQLIDGTELLRKIGALAPEQGQALLKLATAGDFSPPTCPACGIKMTARTSSTEGRKFWGCLNYPRCKRTFFGASNAPA